MSAAVTALKIHPQLKVLVDAETWQRSIQIPAEPLW